MGDFHNESICRGDWRHQIHSALVAGSWASLTAMAKTAPLATLEELAQRLVGSADAAEEISRYLAEEAKKEGRFRDFALDQLVRRLRALPGGWPAKRTWRARRVPHAALAAWQCSMRNPRCEQVMQHIAHALMALEDLPDGWRPAGSDDPCLAALFARYWPQDLL